MAVKPPPPPPKKPPPDATPLDCLPGTDFLRFFFGKTLRDILKAFGAIDASDKWVFVEPIHQWAEKKGGWMAGLLDLASQGAGGALDMQVFLTNFAAKILGQTSGCPTTDITIASLAQVILGFLKEWVVDIPDTLTRPWDYYSGWACPVGVPDPAWLNEALATNTISFSDWRCLTRLNGEAEKWQLLDVNLRQKRPTENDLLTLRRKNWITDEQYSGTMSRLGWTDPNQRNLWEWSQVWTASPQDAVEWMIKDVADPLIQNTFGLGQEFSLKYQGPVKDVFDANGVSQQDAENIWRAHWRNMAPHQLYEMHKRLRPGYFDTWTDDDILSFAQNIAPRTPQGPGAQQEIDQRRQFWGNIPLFREEITDARSARAYLSITVTEAFQVFEALGQSDYPPYWRDKLLAISYNVMTRVDARRAYEIGSINDDRLRAILLDRGYAPQDADALVAFYRLNYILLNSRRPVCNQWVSQGYSAALLRQALLDQGLRPDLYDEVFIRLQTRRQIYIQQKCLAQWKKDYARRLYTDDELRPKLMDAGLTLPEANDLMKAWACEQAAPHRQAAAAALGNEFVTGVITEAQYRQGLSELKYRTKEIRRMVAQRKLVPRPKKWGQAAAPEPVKLPGDE